MSVVLPLYCCGRLFLITPERALSKFRILLSGIRSSRSHESQWQRATRGRLAERQSLQFSTASTLPPSLLFILWCYFCFSVEVGVFAFRKVDGREWQRLTASNDDDSSGGFAVVVCVCVGV